MGQIVDILNIFGGTVTSTCPNAAVTLQVGNARSGEIYNEGTIHLRNAGLQALPVGPGSFDASSGVFTPSQFSSVCSQTWSEDEGNAHWVTQGVLDTRNQGIVSPTNKGETRLYAEGNPKTSIYLDINGNVVMTAQKDITLTSVNNMVNVISSTINLGSSSPGDSAAVASKVGINFSQIATAAQAYLTAAPVTLPQIASALGAFMTALTTPTFENTTSSVVKISG